MLGVWVCPRLPIIELSFQGSRYGASEGRFESWFEGVLQNWSEGIVQPGESGILCTKGDGAGDVTDGVGDGERRGVLVEQEGKLGVYSTHVQMGTAGISNWGKTKTVGPAIDINGEREVCGGDFYLCF